MQNGWWCSLAIGLATLPAGLAPGSAWSQAATANVQSLSVEVDVDYYGGDYRTFAPQKPDANECRAACAGEAQCQAYTFLKPVAGNPTGTCFLKSTVPSATKNPCCISGRKSGQASVGQLPYDEFRPGGTAPPASAPPVPGGLLGQIAPAIRPGLLVVPSQPPQGTPPGQTQAQPYDEFREQTPEPPPPPSPPPSGLNLPGLLGSLAAQGMLALPGQPGASPATPPIPSAPVPPVAAPAPPPTLAVPVPPPAPPAPVPSPPTLVPPAPPLAAPASPPVPPLTVPAAPMAPAPPPAAAAPAPQMAAPGQLAGPSLVPPIAIPAPMVPAPAPQMVAPIPLPTDLTVAFVELPKRVMTGGAIGANAQVVARNAGGGTVPGNSQGRVGYVVDVLLSGAGDLDRGQAVYGLLPEKERLSTDDLGPRASRLFEIGHLPIPADIVPGVYEVCAIIDFDETVAESNEANNTMCQPVEVAARSRPGSPVPGSSFAQPPSPGLGQPMTPSLPVPQPELPGDVPQLDGVIERGDLLFRTGFAEPFQSVELFLPGASSAREVAYQVVGGVAIMEGDIELGDPATLTDRFQAPPPPARIEVPPACDGDVCRRVDPLIASNRPEHLWPGGVIPYTISDRFNAGQRGTIMDGINRLNAAGTPIQLAPRAGETDYVHFEASDRCSSLVGRQGGRQVINLDAGDPAVGGVACWAGQVVHEILHAAGIWHEQSRRDRNNFVQIVWANIENDKRHNFDQHLDDGMDVGPYDIDSLMHYGPTAFGKEDADGNPLTTIRRIDGTPFDANRAGPSPADVAAINQLYANPGSALPPTNQTRILTATIERLEALSEDSCNAEMDFLAEMEIGGGWGWGRGDGGGVHRTGTVEGNHITPGWRHDGSIPPGETRAKVYVRILDDDDVVCGGGDDVVDVSPEPGRGHLELDVNLNTGAIHLGEATRWNRLGALGDRLVLSGANGVENGAIQFNLQVR